ncbi:hypothetical protein TSUD_329670 [Trifolium subterraneum]|nr:hypothetical protein TSUD_329670 [Trifolium subterraneum]
MVSAYLTELWGVYEGFLYAKRMGFKVVDVNVDSKVVVEVVRGKKGGSLVGRALIDMIRRLAELDWDVVVHHAY